MSNVYKLTLPKRTVDDPDPSVSGVLKGVQEKMGMVPAMYAGMVNCPPLLESYLGGYDGFRSSSGFTPVEQEIVFLTISRLHECRYCMAAHSFGADVMSKVPPEVTDAIRNDQPIADTKLEALRQFTRVMAESRGNPTPAHVAHIAGLSIDRNGIPISWFATNRWVTDEFLYPAETVISHLGQYNVDNTPEDPLVNRFLTAMVALYREELANLLRQRDSRLAEITSKHGLAACEAGNDLLAICPIDLDAKIESLDIA